MNYKIRQPFPHAAYVEGQRNFTYFDRSLTSGLTDVIIESPGDFLYIDQASTGVVSVELNMRQGGTLAPILLAAGGSIECDFASFKLTASAQLNKTVRVVVGNGAKIKGGANVSPTSATVQVTDGSRYRTDADQAFLGYSYCAASPGVNAHTQLWNPAASGKNIYIDQLYVGASAAGSFHIRTYSTALSSAMSPLNPTSKKVAGAASVAELRYQNNAALGTLAMASFIAASTTIQVPLREPILLTPGNGLLVVNGAVNADIIASFELWQE